MKGKSLVGTTTAFQKTPLDITTKFFSSAVKISPKINETAENELELHLFCGKETFDGTF
jgi:hypothetical protein